MFFLFLPSNIGDVVLKDLRLKAEALNSLKLPVTVKAGFVGVITLKVLLEFFIFLFIQIKILQSRVTLGMPDIL